MKSPIMALVIMISFQFVAGRSSGRFLMKNGLFIASDNPSAYDPNLNAFIDHDSNLNTPYGHVENHAADCGQEMRPWQISSAKSATKEKKVSFRLSPSVQKTNNPPSPATADTYKGVSNLLPKGAVTPSGPSPIVNSMVTEQRLSTSSNSPGVGHMQMIRPKSLTVNGHNLKSHHSQGDVHVKQEKNIKRKLGSTPSPGVGN